MEIEHREDESRFVVAQKDVEAELTYRSLDDTTLEYEHTYVPSELRGGGLGGKLVRTALDYARDKGYKVRATCPFVAAFIERHPEYKALEA